MIDLAFGEEGMGMLGSGLDENVCFILNDEEDIEKVVIPVFTEGLEKRQKCFFIGSLYAFRKIIKGLDDIGVDISSSIREKDFIFVENSYLYNLNLFSLIEYITLEQKKDTSKKVRIIIQLQKEEEKGNQDFFYQIH